jgi:GNAT superfamily N-acetyltransferase
MTPSEILALFDAERRAEPLPEPGVQYERAGAVLRATGVQNWIARAELHDADVDAVIATEAAYFRSIGAEVEWKVYGHDRPADLAQRLAAAGFEPEEPETLMIYDLGGGSPPGAVPAGIVIRRIIETGGLADLVAVQREAFGEDRVRMAEELRRRLGDPALGLYVAYASLVPVAAARLEMPPGRSFAGLWGGATLPAYRGRGIYRGLVAVRAEEAVRRGYRFLRVDARESSRPILERLGFVALTSIMEWRLRPERPDVGSRRHA